MTATIGREQITGMVLAGGRGSRMGGVDKGLQNFRGMPLALHSLLRLQAQVGETMLNANRNLAPTSRGRTGLARCDPRLPRPLAGFLSGLERCETPYLVVGRATRRCFGRPGRAARRAFADDATEIAVAAPATAT